MFCCDQWRRTKTRLIDFVLRQNEAFFLWIYRRDSPDNPERAQCKASAQAKARRTPHRRWPMPATAARPYLRSWLRTRSGLSRSDAKANAPHCGDGDQDARREDAYGVPTAQVAGRTAQRMDQGCPWLPTDRHARLASDASRVEARLPGARSTPNGYEASKLTVCSSKTTGLEGCDTTITTLPAASHAIGSQKDRYTARVATINPAHLVCRPDA